MKKSWLGWIIVLVLAGSTIAVAAPVGIDAFHQWVEDTLADHEARITVLEGGSLPTTTTILPSTTTTSSQPSTTTSTTLPPVTTTTAPPTTTTTVAPTTTTTAVSPSTTTTTTPPSSIINLSGDWSLVADSTFDSFTINGNGHDILIDGFNVNWSNFTINNVGRIMWHDACGVANLSNGTVLNSGAEELGGYPIHFHLCGDATRGSVLDNVTVRNSANRAFVPHGSNGISFLNIEAYNIADTAFWWDAPGTNESCSFQKFCTLDNSNDIVIDGAFFDGITNGFDDNRGFRLAGFSLGAGSGNIIRNATVLNVTPSHLKDCSGFSWPESANQNVGGNVWVFENNHAETDCHGIFVWQNDGNLHIVDGFTGGGIDHGAYGNNYDYRNVNIPYVEIHAVGWVMSDSVVGDVILQPHTFSGSVVWTNVNINGQIIRSDAGRLPITFTVNGTNATCGDVTGSGHPQTVVILNGEVC